ncbi:MAG TPA: type II toxin-antitoxin system RelE/ParE family toxin [Thermodesulfobacteriota bacterium]|nr:type II toxin-antitoxin system RelE/ParE family toxin [Thermodesulfobacteriota bacterium]
MRPQRWHPFPDSESSLSNVRRQLEYRLRFGNWRILFEVEGDRIIIYRIMHRKDVYRFGG